MALVMSIGHRFGTLVSMLVREMSLFVFLSIKEILSIKEFLSLIIFLSVIFYYNVHPLPKSSVLCSLQFIIAAVNKLNKLYEDKPPDYEILMRKEWQKYYDKYRHVNPQRAEHYHPIGVTPQDEPELKPRKSLTAKEEANRAFLRRLNAGQITLDRLHDGLLEEESRTIVVDEQATQNVADESLEEQELFPASGNDVSENGKEIL